MKVDATKGEMQAVVGIRNKEISLNLILIEYNNNFKELLIK
jgi:hypothetical protein